MSYFSQHLCAVKHNRSIDAAEDECLAWSNKWALPLHSYWLQSRDQCGWLQHKDMSRMESCQKDSGLFDSSWRCHQLSYTPPTPGCTGTHTPPAHPAQSDHGTHWGDRETERTHRRMLYSNFWVSLKRTSKVQTVDSVRQTPASHSVQRHRKWQV